MYYFMASTPKQAGEWVEELKRHIALIQEIQESHMPKTDLPKLDQQEEKQKPQGWAITPR